MHTAYASVRNFYGGELPKVAKMVVTQPESLDYGVITEATTKTFTIANTGKATLEGISVTSSNSSIFAISGAPTSLAADESAEVTITMAATTIGNLSSEITVGATDMEDVKSSDAVVAGTYDYVTLKRTFTEGWNTVCLPFAISDVEGFFGAGAKAYEFSSYANDELGFSVATTLTASYPYVVYVPAAITEDIELTDITIASGDAEPWYTRKQDVYALYFRGTYAPIAAGEWTKSDESDIIYGLTTDGYIMKAGANASIKGFRAYFDFSAQANAVKALRFGDIEVGINTLSDSPLKGENIYNLAGQRIQKMQKGINIINGKKILK